MPRDENIIHIDTIPQTSQIAVLKWPYRINVTIIGYVKLIL